MAKRKRPDDQGQDNLDNINDADSFGLPDIEYKPLDTPQENPSQPEAETPTYEEPVASEQPAEVSEPVAAASEPPVRESYKSSYSYTPEEPKSNASLIIAIVIGLVILVAGFLIYQYVYVPQQEKEKQELARKAEEERKQREEKERLAKEEEERRKREAEAAANATPKEGTIETLSERTRRYYVVVSSAIDDDLVMDYARKLSAKGVSSKIIPPFGKYKFFRLAIADHDSFASAQANADAVKGDYGNEVWVIKY